MKKLKVCVNSEFSALSTGFAVYSKNLLQRLYEQDWVDVCEFAQYGTLTKARENKVPWTFYANEPESGPELEEYNSNPTNQFGRFRLDRMLLDFRPDVVITLKDPHMDRYLHQTPLRPFYHLIQIPTVDSTPYPPEWIEQINNADSVFCYSKYAKESLLCQTKKVNIVGIAPPGVDLQTFKPVKNKVAHKKKMGVNPDSIIFAFFSRNQFRKLSIDLFYCFRKYLDSVDKETAKKSYLMLHTSWPDIGFDIPWGLKEFQISNKVLFSYVDKIVKKPFISLFADGRCYSPFTNGATGVFPSTVHGITSEQLADLYNVGDLFIQYSIAEGAGMTAMEALACGVPTAETCATAMKERVIESKGYPLNIQRVFMDDRVMAFRFYPSHKHLVDIMTKFSLLTEEQKLKKSRQARKYAERNFNWGKTTDTIIDYVKTVKLVDLQGKWDSPQRYVNIPVEIPQNLDHPQLMSWLYTDCANEPDKVNSVQCADYLMSLQYGGQISGHKIKPMNQQIVFDTYKNYCQNKQLVELARTGQLKLEPCNFVLRSK